MWTAEGYLGQGLPSHLHRQFVLNPTNGQKDVSKQTSSGVACAEKQIGLTC